MKVLTGAIGVCVAIIVPVLILIPQNSFALTSSDGGITGTGSSLGGNIRIGTAEAAATKAYMSPAGLIKSGGLAADAQCNPVIPSCPCNTVPGPDGCVPGANKFMCPPGVCMDVTSGFSTPGTCVAPLKCQALSTSGLNGFGTDILKSVLGSVFQKLMQGSKGSGGDSSGGSVAPGAVSTGCVQYYNVTTPTTDPCAIYVQPVSDSIGNSGSNSSAVSDYLNQLAIDSDTNTNTNVSDALNAQVIQSSVIVKEQPPTATSTVLVAPPSGAAGVRGDILLLNNGGTVLAASVDLDNSSVTAGFYGGDSFTNKPTGVVAGICQNRPWQESVLSYVIPPAFFDTLCTLRGYTVGAPVAAPVPQVKLVQKPVAPTIATSSTFTSDIPPKVDIWAVPTSVTLGSRTSIFWSSQGVRDCNESSSDNSFTQSTLSGSASTLPFASERTFTISCSAPDGTVVASSVTVYIAQ